MGPCTMTMLAPTVKLHLKILVAMGSKMAQVLPHDRNQSLQSSNLGRMCIVCLDVCECMSRSSDMNSTPTLAPRQQTRNCRRLLKSRLRKKVMQLSYGWETTFE